MPEDQKHIRPHSSDYFGEERDYWWNSDFLDLIAQRLNLRSVSSLVDVGCGVGHWTALLRSRIAPNATVLGFDSDPVNVAAFRLRMATILPGDHTVEARVGDALALDLPSGVVDAATCQTLLLHLNDPAEALTEMVRVTRRGGLVIAHPTPVNGSTGSFADSTYWMVSNTAARLSFAVPTTDRKAA